MNDFRTQSSLPMGEVRALLGGAEQEGCAA